VDATSLPAVRPETACGPAGMGRRGLEMDEAMEDAMAALTAAGAQRPQGRLARASEGARRVPLPVITVRRDAACCGRSSAIRPLFGRSVRSSQLSCS